MTIEISMEGVIDEAYFTARIVEDLVTEITDRVTDSVVRQIDLRDLAAEFDTYDVAQYVCTSDVASNIDLNSLADEVDHGEIAACFSVASIALSIVGDMGEDLYQDVANAMSQNAPIMDQIVRRLRSEDTTIQTYDGLTERMLTLEERVDRKISEMGRVDTFGDLGLYIEETAALAERVKVLEERLNGVMRLLDNFSCDASRTDLRVIADRHPVL